MAEPTKSQILRDICKCNREIEVIRIRIRTARRQEERTRLNKELSKLHTYKKVLSNRLWSLEATL